MTLIRQNEQTSPIAAEESGSILTGKRVVIAEDQGVTQLQLRKILVSVGCIVVGSAANGSEAVEIVLSTQPDLVIMDVEMPEMDGLEATRRVLKGFNGCIVIMTAYSEPELVQKAFAAGAFGYVVKPVTSASLIPRLTSLLKEFYKR